MVPVVKHPFTAPSLPQRVGRLELDPGHPAQTPSGRLKQPSESAREPALPLKGQAGSTLTRCNVGQAQDPNKKTGEEKTWDVRRSDPVLGVGRLLGQVVAPDRTAADVAAAEAFPTELHLLVCLAMRTRRRSRSTLGDL